MIHFSSDLHFDHKHVIQYCNRPFVDRYVMNEELIRKWNEKVAPEDTVYDCGDFCFAIDETGFEKRLNGHIVHIKGNHDRRKWLDFAGISYGGYKFFMQHHPPIHDREFPEGFDVFIHGHVHEKWHLVDFNGRPIINVGVDVNGFAPVSIETVKKMVDKFYSSKK